MVAARDEVGFVTGIPWVRISHTAPIMGTGTYHTVICMVSDETHSILIIKITIIITLLTYFKKNKRGDTMATAHTR